MDLAGVVHPAEDIRGHAGVDGAAEAVREAAVDLGRYGARSEGLAFLPALDDGADEAARHHPAGGRGFHLWLGGRGRLGVRLLDELHRGGRGRPEGLQIVEHLLELRGVPGALRPVLLLLLGVEGLPLPVKRGPRLQIGQNFRDGKLRAHRTSLNRRNVSLRGEPSR